MTASDELKRRLSALRRGQEEPASAATAARPRSGDLGEYFPEGGTEETARGELFTCSLPLDELLPDASGLVARYLGALARARQLAEEGVLSKHLQPAAAAEAEEAALIDTETAGFQGRPLFLVGLIRFAEGRLLLSQYFARTYAQEAALLDRLASVLPEVKLLISFNGKSFDWPFVRDRMVYHRLTCRAEFAHLDLLHASRRRWRGELPNCRLQTLERFLCRRWRRGDIPGAEIPQRYHDFVRRQEPGLIAPIFHHNRLDLVTMVEILIALMAAEREETIEERK